MKRSLIIGYGSIGSRHARILQELGVEVGVVSARSIDFTTAFHSVGEALRSFSPDYVVVANETAKHFSTLQELGTAGFRGTVLVEKPLFDHAPQGYQPSFKKIYTAYNLRFHPVLRRLRELVAGERVISVQCCVGKHLETWRPLSDYRHSYSGRKTSGGGVLRDLSHELDYLVWIFGAWKKLTARGGHFSSLEIDSDDVFSLLMEMDRCPVVSLQVNYLDRIGRREICVNTDKLTLRADLIKQTLEINERVEKFSVERDDTYRLEHRAVMEGKENELVSYAEGLEIVKMIEAAEKASHGSLWVNR